MPTIGSGRAAAPRSNRCGLFRVEGDLAVPGAGALPAVVVRIGHDRDAFELVHLHLACATPNLKVVEYMNTGLEGDRVWYTGFPQQQGGMWAPYPDKPGLGLELDPAAVEQWAV